MKLFEIYGRGIDRDTEQNWREQQAAQAAQRGQTQTGASATKGIWLLSQQGKRLAGPFADEAKAKAYQAGRPDRIPSDAVIKRYDR